MGSTLSPPGVLGSSRRSGRGYLPTTTPTATTTNTTTTKSGPRSTTSLELLTLVIDHIEA